MNRLRDYENWISNVINETFNDSDASVYILKEGKGHLDHPEDLVFLGGSQGIRRAIQSIEQTVKNPGTITIKWDGYPALIFGRNQDGKFTIMDKHMFNKKDDVARNLFSINDWIRYEQARGDKQRTSLIEIVKSIWPGLEKSFPRNHVGYYWGDLLFSTPLQNQNGLYKFRANPNGIAYTVEVNSDVGKFLTGKNAGIVVHQYIPVSGVSTDEAVALNGTIGELKNAADVAIVPASMPITPKLAVPSGLLQRAKAMLAKYGTVIDDLMNYPPQSKNAFEQLFTTYINRKIVSGDLQNIVQDFYNYFNQRPMTDVMRTKLTQYLNSKKGAVKAAFATWVSLYNLKNSVVKQLDRAASASPVKGYLQDGTQTQEGFVSNGLKFVNRMGFARQNLAARQQVSENDLPKKNLVVIYPGGFHPFHLGHASVFKHLQEKFNAADVYVAASSSTTERPFQFNDKKYLANQSGVPLDRFVEVRSPYKSKEIMRNYDPNNTILIFAVSEKDKDRFNFNPKKDGSPSYFQPFNGKNLQSFNKHGYIYVTPKLNFKILGQTVDSASKIRSMYAQGDDQARATIASELYPNSNNTKKVKKILDKYLGDHSIAEADNPNYFGGSSLSPISGTPKSLQPHPDAEEMKQYKKEMDELKRFMGH
jgi:hypothetical protein